MYEQQILDFTDRQENNTFSQAILSASKVKINRCCMKVLNLLLEGKRLTVLGAAKEYDISYLPRRIKDLRDMAGIPVQDQLIKGEESVYKEYFL